MSRIRTIKPEFFTSSDIASLTPLARLFYVSLWCESDREGRLNWKPATLKLRYFPADDCDIDILATELIEAGLVVIYQHEGKDYAEIPSFKSHQVINNRESESTLPPRVKVASERVQAEGRKEGKERKGTSRHPDAESILEHLNKKASRDYKPVDSNISIISARLAEGATVAECMAVIDRKCIDWLKDEKMNEYLRPNTLFNATKFAQYVGALGSAKPSESGHPALHPQFRGMK